MLYVVAPSSPTQLCSSLSLQLPTIGKVRADLWHCKDRYDDKKPMTNGQLQEMCTAACTQFDNEQTLVYEAND